MARTLVSRRSTTSVTPTTFTGTCSQDISVGDVVIMINDVWQRADCNIYEKVPASGLVVEKVAATGCRVACFGTVKVPFSVIPGKNYYLSSNGKIEPHEPFPLESQIVFSQQIGSAVSDSELMLSIKETYIIQPTESYHTFINTRRSPLPGK